MGDEFIVAVPVLLIEMPYVVPLLPPEVVIVDPLILYAPPASFTAYTVPVEEVAVTVIGELMMLVAIVEPPPDIPVAPVAPVVIVMGEPMRDNVPFGWNMP